MNRIDGGMIDGFIFVMLPENKNLNNPISAIRLSDYQTLDDAIIWIRS